MFSSELHGEEDTFKSSRGLTVPYCRPLYYVRSSRDRDPGILKRDSISAMSPITVGSLPNVTRSFTLLFYILLRVKLVLTILDLVIATSGPSSSYPKRVYRNPTETLVRFLDSKHGEDWKIWEFRAEGTGYPDSEVYGRIEHFPWPDHHPPPFALIPPMVASMRNWLHEKPGKRVVVVHCKAGKGRSGTAASSYLICEEGWKAEDAMQRFTERRMRVGFGEGVSIPSQVRWVGYVNRWVNEMGKIYMERPVEVVEVRVWGLRDGVEVGVEGFVDEGRTIKRFHSFSRKEREAVDEEEESAKSSDQSENDVVNKVEVNSPTPSSTSSSSVPQTSQDVPSRKTNSMGIASAIIAATPDPPPASIAAAVFRPSNKLIIPTPDINIDFERRTKAAYTKWTVTTSIAHIWFNPYFEGGDKQDDGVFSTRWEEMDGIKGTTSKGIRALDRLEVVWRYTASTEEELSDKEREGKEGENVGQKEDSERKRSIVKVISEPAPGEPIPERQAADWRGNNPSKEEDEEEDDRIGIADIGEKRKENEIPVSDDLAKAAKTST